VIFVLGNIVNVSPDSMVYVSGARLNWGDVGSLLQSGFYPFGKWNPNGQPLLLDLQQFIVSPLMTQAALTSSAALNRATAFFGPTANVCMASWPDSDTTLAYPPMKAGIGATCYNEEDGGYPCVIFVWVVPADSRPITLTRFEVISYASISTTGGDYTLPDGRFLDQVNFPGFPDNNPVQQMALVLTTWSIPGTITSVDDPGFGPEFFSFFMRDPTWAGRAALGTPAVHAVLLPPQLWSHNRDFLSDGSQAIPIPGSPIVVFDLFVGSQLLPLYRGSVDYTGAEIAFDEAHQIAVADGMAHMARVFCWAFLELVGQIEWEDPEIGDVLQIVIDLIDPPTPPPASV
jgi:hypothetical protein